MTAPDRIVVDLEHVRLHALTWGDATAPLAICLHGFPDSAWTWRHLGPVLADAGYRVVAPFTRGYAPSEIPADGDYHVAALAHDALALHRALDGDDRAVLIGHDWGALTVHGIAAAEHPFRRVVALAVPPIAAIREAGTSARSQLRLLARQSLMSWYIAYNQLPFLPERSLDRLIPLLWRRWGPRRGPHPDPADITNALATVPTTAHGSAVLGYYRAMTRPRVDRRYADLATTWLQPPSTAMLYLHGVDDGCMQVGFVDGLDELLPAGSTVVRVADAGHFVHLDQPDVTHRHIIDFLGSPPDMQAPTGPVSGAGRTLDAMSTPTAAVQQVSFTGVGGVTLRADEWRPRTEQGGSTILLLHGGGQTRHSWKKTGERLAGAGAHVVSLDTRGHGDSDWSPDGRYSLELFTGDVVEVVRQMGRPVTLVGASMGGLSGIGAAATLGPDVVEALVLVDVVPRFDQQGSARIRDFMTGNVDGFDTLHDAADAISAYLPHRDKTFNPEGLKRNLRQGDDGRWYWHWDPAFVRSKPGDDRFVRAEHLEEQLASLAAPILLIRGKLSDVVPADAVEGFRAVVPAAEVVELADAAHTAAADDNDAFTQVVLDFIGAHR